MPRYVKKTYLCELLFRRNDLEAVGYRDSRLAARVGATGADIVQTALRGDDIPEQHQGHQNK